jgi:alanine racemase
MLRAWLETGDDAAQPHPGGAGNRALANASVTAAPLSRQRPTRVGVVACGYADGYPRHAPGGTPIVVAGRRTQTLGRVSMDMLACDLTALPDAGVDSPVVLWGEGLPADEVATCRRHHQLRAVLCAGPARAGGRV